MQVLLSLPCLPPPRRIVITIRIRRSAKYWEKVDKKARGPEMNVWVGWRVRFSFDKEEAKEKESRGKDVEVEVLRVEVE